MVLETLKSHLAQLTSDIQPDPLSNDDATIALPSNTETVALGSSEAKTMESNEETTLAVSDKEPVGEGTSESTKSQIESTRVAQKNLNQPNRLLP